MLRLAITFAALFALFSTADAQRTDQCARFSYYWEVGNSTGVQDSGRIGTEAPTATTPLEIASASKWLYGSFALERNPVPSIIDVHYLTMTSGYNDFTRCYAFQTIAACASAGDNDKYTAVEDGEFSYGGGHMQQHAVLTGLGALTAATLGTQASAALGVPVAYSTPQPAGGAVVSPAAYGAFLRKLMRSELALTAYLGRYAVCTDPATCSTALESPLPDGTQWFYSLGHWVEDDGTFSSPGALGFYPWITADRAQYGIVVLDRGTGWAAAKCGRQIRNTLR